MAGDHTLVDPGSSPTVPVASDTDTNGDVWQRFKLGWGVDGSPADATVANPLPVQIISGSISVTGTMPVSVAVGAELDGHSATIGATGDASSALTLVGLLKNIKAALAGTLTVGAHAVTNAGTFAIQDSQKIVDNAAFTDNATPVQPVGFVFDEVAGTALTENDAAAARIDSKRAQVHVIEDATTRGQRAGVNTEGGQLVAGATLAVPFTTTTVQAVATTDVGNYAWASVQITSQGTSSTVTFQGSNDNATWVTILATNAVNGTGATTSTVAAIYQVPLGFRYFRLNVTGISAGTTAGVIQFFANPRQSTPGGLVSQPTDGASAAAPLSVASFQSGFNSATATWDRWRSNQDSISLLASAARTTTQTVADQTNFNGRGVVVTLDVTSAGTGSITLEIDYKDPVSGKYLPLLTGAAVVANGTTQYTVYPGITAAANAAASMILPRTWRVVVTANNANPVTYSVGAAVLL